VSRRGVVWSLAIAGTVTCLALAGWYRYQDLNYVMSDYAWVNAPAVWLTTPQAGQVTRVDVHPGELVHPGEPVAVERTATGQRVTLSAKVGGRIAAQPVAAGSDVVAGTPVAAIVQTGSATVLAEIPETSMANVTRGQTVTVTLDGFPGHTYTGIVSRIGRSTLSTTSPLLSVSAFTKEVQYVPVTIRIPGGIPAPVVAGETADVTIHI
jgi:multidrug resistance efflux pump